MLDPVPYFRFLGIVEVVQGSHQIAGDSPDPLKFHISFLSAAGWAGVIYNSRKPAHRIPIHRMVYGSSST